MNSTVISTQQLEEIVALLKEAQDSLLNNTYAKNKINLAIKKLQR